MQKWFVSILYFPFILRRALYLSPSHSLTRWRVMCTVFYVKLQFLMRHDVPVHNLDRTAND